MTEGKLDRWHVDPKYNFKEILPELVETDTKTGKEFVYATETQIRAYVKLIKALQKFNREYIQLEEKCKIPTEAKEETGFRSLSELN